MSTPQSFWPLRDRAESRSSRSMPEPSCCARSSRPSAAVRELVDVGEFVEVYPTRCRKQRRPRGRHAMSYGRGASSWRSACAAIRRGCSRAPWKARARASLESTRHTQCQKSLKSSSMRLDHVLTAASIFGVTPAACLALSASAHPRNSSGEGKPKQVL